MKRGVAALFIGAVVSAAPLDYGSILHWSADDLVAGRAANLPAVNRTHAYQLLRLNASSKAESHEGTSDVFFIVAGSGAMRCGHQHPAVHALHVSACCRRADGDAIADQRRHAPVVDRVDPARDPASHADPAAAGRPAELRSGHATCSSK